MICENKTIFYYLRKKLNTRKLMSGAVYLFTNPSIQAIFGTRLIFLTKFIVVNSDFYSPSPIALLGKIVKLTFYLSRAGRRTSGFIRFQCVLAV